MFKIGNIVRLNERGVNLYNHSCWRKRAAYFKWKVVRINGEIISMKKLGIKYRHYDHYHYTFLQKAQ